MEKVSNAEEVVVGQYYWLISKVVKNANGEPSGHISRCIENDDNEATFGGATIGDNIMCSFDIYGPIEKPVIKDDNSNNDDRLPELISKACEYFRSLKKLSDSSKELEDAGIVDYEDDDEGELLDNDIAKLEIFDEFMDGLNKDDLVAIRDHYASLGEYGRVLVMNIIIDGTC